MDALPSKRLGIQRRQNKESIGHCCISRLLSLVGCGSVAFFWVCSLLFGCGGSTSGLLVFFFISFCLLFFDKSKSTNVLVLLSRISVNEHGVCFPKYELATVQVLFYKNFFATSPCAPGDVSYLRSLFSSRVPSHAPSTQEFWSAASKSTPRNSFRSKSA